MDTMMGDEKEEGEHELIGAGYLTHSLPNEEEDASSSSRVSQLWKKEASLQAKLH
jgi:hypothetical protein